MKILITGALGFIGRNLISTLKTMKEYEIFSYDLENSIDDLRRYTKKCDFVIHLAGMNRPKRAEEFYETNVGFTEILCDLLSSHDNKCPIMLSSSIHASQDNDYGKSKKASEEVLFKYGSIHNASIYIYRFANLFGKWCRPNYNSVVATWCHNVSRNQEIIVTDPEIRISLCYIDDVVLSILNLLKNYKNMQSTFLSVTPVYDTTLGEIASMLYSFKNSRKDLHIPNMEDALIKNLYSTYTSYLPANEFSYELKMNHDQRGSFSEFLKTENYGQVSINISKPGIVKGNHWHHTKTEKFLVVSGEGLIQFRNLCSNEVINYRVSGQKLEVIDIPVGFTHNIKNIGSSDMVTIMWANEKFHQEKPDTFYEEV